MSHSVSSSFLGGGLSSAVFALTNPSSNPVDISNLAFAINIASFDMFTQDPSALAYGAPMNFTLAGGQSVNISLGDVAAGSMIVARGIGNFGDGAPDNFFAEFTTAVPEPGSSILVGSFLAGWASWRFG